MEFQIKRHRKISMDEVKEFIAGLTREELMVVNNEIYKYFFERKKWMDEKKTPLRS